MSRQSKSSMKISNVRGTICLEGFFQRIWNTTRTEYQETCVSVESDFPLDRATRKSTIGMILRFRRHPIKTISNLQTSVGLDVRECEFYALFHGSAHGLGLLKTFLHDLGIILACPPRFFGEQREFFFFGLMWRFARGTEADHSGTTSVRKQLANQAYDTNFEVAAVGGSLGLKMHAARLRVFVMGRRQVLRCDYVNWIPAYDAENAEITLRFCPFCVEVDEEPARQVRANKVLIFLDDSTRSTRWMTHFFRRSWCGHCVKGFAVEDHHRRWDRSKAVIPKRQFDCMFFGDHSQVRTVQRPVPRSPSCLHDVDIQTFMRIALVGQNTWSQLSWAFFTSCGTRRSCWRATPNHLSRLSHSRSFGRRTMIG